MYYQLEWQGITESLSFKCKLTTCSYFPFLLSLAVQYFRLLSEGKRATVNRNIGVHAHLPISGLTPVERTNHNVWDALPMRRKTYGYIPSFTASTFR